MSSPVLVLPLHWSSSIAFMHMLYEHGREQFLNAVERRPSYDGGYDALDDPRRVRRGIFMPSLLCHDTTMCFNSFRSLAVEGWIFVALTAKFCTIRDGAKRYNS